MKAWHFISSDRRLKYGDGRLVVDGETLHYEGSKPIKLCSNGLHFSVNALDALHYAPGLIACYVEVPSTSLLGDDKGVAHSRKVIKSVDATEVVIKFAIIQAKQVYNNTTWMKWANKWISGEDRTAYAARAAARAAYAARAADAADAADARAAYAARAAAYAARAAADAARDAAYAARDAAYAAADARATPETTKQIQNKLLESMLFEALGTLPN